MTGHDFVRIRFARVAASLLMLAGTGAGVANAAEPAYSSWWLPPNIAAGYGDRLDLVFIIIGWVTLVGAVAVLGVLLYALVRYRARPGHQARYQQGNHRVQWAMVLLVTVTVIGGEVLVMGRISDGIWGQLKEEVPEGAMEVEVLAEQFGWNVRYPGADGMFGATDRELMAYDNPFGLDEDDPAAADDVVTLGELHVPVGQPVLVRLSSKDVIHSFYIPVLRIKQDAVPGERINVWFEARESGSYQLACAELCGLGHSTMSAGLVAESTEEFQAWLAGMAAN